MKNIYKEYFAFMKKAKSVYISSVDENTKTGLKLERQLIYFNEKLFQILLLLKLHFH